MAPNDYAIHTPPSLETTNTNDVRITRVSNGFCISVGCKMFVAKTWTEVSTGLALYYKDPDAARKKYCEDEKTREER